MKKENLIFLDTETTGTEPADRLCQVAYVFEGHAVEGLFKPPVPISIDAMVVTHITNKMVADREAFAPSEMCQNLKRIFEGETVLVAHNARFDAKMLGHEGVVVKEMIDTFKLSHALDPEGVIPRHNLQYLRYYHDLEVGEVVAHDALGDVRVLEKLFDFYFEKMLLQYSDEEAVLREMLAISARPVLMKKFTFGKYNGMDVKQVAMEDAGYLLWLFNQKVMTREQGGEDDENWIYTLDYYLNPKKKDSSSGV